jgi:hypothetical protein
MAIASEQDRQAERDRTGDNPLRPSERLQEENPVDSPAGVDNRSSGEPGFAPASDRATQKEKKALESGEELPG